MFSVLISRSSNDTGESKFLVGAVRKNRKTGKLCLHRWPEARTFRTAEAELPETQAKNVGGLLSEATLNAQGYFRFARCATTTKSKDPKPKQGLV